jgi:alpha-glucosidase
MVWGSQRQWRVQRTGKAVAAAFSHGALIERFAVQEEDPDALIHHYRRAIALPYRNPALAKSWRRQRLGQHRSFTRTER